MQVALAGTKNRRPIIELAGPPGVGKSSLAERLLPQHHDLYMAVCPYFRRLRDVPFFAKNTVAIVPSLLRLHRSRNGEWLTPRDVVMMVASQGWPRELRRLAAKSGGPILVDEGAICFLSKLRGFGSATIQGEGAKDWWNSTYKQWAETLDLIIVLEAPARMLLQRVRGRGLPHETDGWPEEEAVTYLERIGAAQRQVLAELAAVAGGPQILRFNTEDYTADQIVSSHAVNLWNHR